MHDHSAEPPHRPVRRLSPSLIGFVVAWVSAVVLALSAAGFPPAGAAPGGIARAALALAAAIAAGVGGLLFVALRDRLQRVEAAMDETRSRFTQVTDALRDVVWLSTADKSALLYVSPAFEEIWERPVEEAYADPLIWLEQVHPDDRERIRRALPGQVEGRFDEEYRIVFPDGRVKWVRDRAFAVRSAHGATSRIAGVAEDITRHKELEEEILRSHGLRSVARLAAGVGHDFNNRLTVIQSHAQLLLADLGDNPRFRADLDAIRRAAAECAGLTRKLLAFGRQQVLVPRRVAPGPFLKESLPLLRNLVPPTVELELALPEAPLPEVEADPSHLREALLNVVAHSASGVDDGGAIRVSLRTLETVEAVAVEGGERLPPGRFVAFEIVDTAETVPDSVRSRLFEPFRQGVQLEGSGDGLALASALGIVQQSGGGIRVAPIRGGGTTFTLLLPAAVTRSGF